jgi:hypothetical protein
MVDEILVTKYLTYKFKYLLINFIGKCKIGTEGAKHLSKAVWPTLK